MLCKSPAAGQAMFRRMIFNLFSVNQDDHSKNGAFLQNDLGQWQLAPFYDTTFSPSPHQEHATAFLGYGQKTPIKIIQKLAVQANFSNWRQAQAVIQEVVEAINSLTLIADDLGAKTETTRLIMKQLKQTYQENKSLLA